MLNLHLFNELDIAKYVMLNAPSWKILTKELPTCGGPAKTIEIQRIVGDQIIIDELSQNLKRGFSYSYPTTTNVQGLTSVSNCPYLYGSMAPDQYTFLQATALPDSAIQKITALFEQTSNLDGLKELTFNNFNVAFEVVINFLRNKNLEITNENEWKIVQIIQASIGDQCIRAIAKELKREYFAISITGQRLTEASGFDIPQNVNILPTSEQSVDMVHALIDGQKDKIARVKIYTEPHPYVKEHMVIQSDRAIGDDEDCNLRIAINDVDMPILVRFYERTMAKNLPLVINCTDGIDRTGILMVAFMMLYLNDQEDFTFLCEVEQRELLIELIENMRMDRGPYFLRQEPDIARAILLGYTLIATKKAMNNDVSLVEKRKTLSQQFASVNEDFKNSYINKFRDLNIKVSRKNKLHRIEDTPVDIYNIVMENKCYIYRFAVKNFLKSPNIINLMKLNKLLMLGKESAQLSMYNALVELGYPGKFIEYLIKISENENSKKQIKAELAHLSFLDTSALKMKVEDLIEKAKAKENKDKKMKKLLIILKETFPSSSKSKSKSKSKSHSPDEIDSLNTSLGSLSLENAFDHSYNVISFSSSFPRSTDVSSDNTKVEEKKYKPKKLIESKSLDDVIVTPQKSKKMKRRSLSVFS